MLLDDAAASEDQIPYMRASDKSGWRHQGRTPVFEKGGEDDCYCEHEHAPTRHPEATTYNGRTAPGWRTRMVMRYRRRRKSIIAVLTSPARSCWVQWPQPGSMIVPRSWGTKFDRLGMSWSMPGNANTGSRSPTT